jgi:hypothetical protein
LFDELQNRSKIVALFEFLLAADTGKHWPKAPFWALTPPYWGGNSDQKRAAFTRLCGCQLVPRFAALRGGLTYHFDYFTHFI